MFLAALPAAVSAQWPNYPTSGVPKTSDGKPNLEGAVPKAADGHPILTGLWDFVRDKASAPPPVPDASTGLSVVAPGRIHSSISASA